MQKRVISILLVLFLGGGMLSALTVKLGSPFPEGSAWDQSLREVAEEWREISGGRVTLRIFAGGVVGDEPDMIRKMRIGQLDGGVFTPIGIKVMVPNTFIVTLPYVVQSEEELNYAVANILPRFDEDFRDAGFEVLAWAKSGWARMFAKEALETPEDLRGMRISASVSDQELISSFKLLGYNVVPLNLNELMVSLQNGLADCFYTLPMGAAVYQWFGIANHMLEVPFSPVVGGIVLSSRTWNRIPANLRDELRASLQAVTEEFYLQSEEMHQAAMEVMLDNGLVVDNPTPEQNIAWQEAFTEIANYVVSDGGTIDVDVYEDIVQELAEFRASR